MTNKYAPETTTSKGRHIQVSDVELYFEEYGEGYPLVLLHGFGGCTQNWAPFIPELSEQYRLIVVDLRGHGYSTNPSNKFSHRQAAIDVSNLLDKLGIDQFSAMGMSTGGMTLLHIATSQPERIRSMVLISTTTSFPDQARTIMRRASFQTMPKEVRDMYRECAKRGDEQIRVLIKQFNVFSEDYTDINFTAENLSLITARTLIVHGDRDNFFPVEIAVSMYRSVSHSSLWIIPNGDHVPVFDSKIPFASTALRFLMMRDDRKH